LTQLCFFNKAVSYALGKVGKPRVALKDEQVMAIQHVYGKDVFIWLPTDTAAGQVRTYEFLPLVFVPHIHFGKAEVAYHHLGLVS